MRKVLLTLALFLTVTLVAAAQDNGTYYVYIVHPPGNPPGWVSVQQYLVGSGCEGYACGSTWTPNTMERNLFEKRSDRAPRGHGEGDGAPPSPLPVWDGREKCGDGRWAGGTWYHNGYFRLTWHPPVCRWEYNRFGPGEHAYVCEYNGSWQGPTGEGWNFAENDACFLTHPADNPTPPPQPNPDPGPEPTPCPVTARGYAPARMTGFRSFPQHPVVAGQGGGGFYLAARFTAGRFWEEDCRGRRYSDDPITYVAVSVSLAESSRRWIEEELAARYYGARVKDTYPKRAVLFVGRSAAVAVRWPRRGLFPALDPGYYIATFTVRTASGRVFVFSGRAPVYLGDSTLIR